MRLICLLAIPFLISAKNINVEAKTIEDGPCGQYAKIFENYDRGENHNLIICANFHG